MSNIRIINNSKFLSKECPIECLPKRFAIATNIILCTENINKEKGFLLFNYEPEKWNQWYPFFGSYNGSMDFSGKTYFQIVKEFEEKVLNSKDSQKRIDNVKSDFSKMLNIPINFDLEKSPVEDEMWLKFSKTQNVWTFYYLEFFQITNLPNFSLDYIKNDSTEIISLTNSNLHEITTSGKYKGVPIVENTLDILCNKHLLNELTKTTIKI